ncbi:MAG: hypothetical protein R2873_16000 [Caldilineaceae bacterium]
MDAASLARSRTSGSANRGRNVYAELRQRREVAFLIFDEVPDRGSGPPAERFESSTPAWGHARLYSGSSERAGQEIAFGFVIVRVGLMSSHGTHGSSLVMSRLIWRFSSFPDRSLSASNFQYS